LLLANGHSEAPRYPLGVLWDEAQIVVARENRHFATTAILLQMAVSSMFSKDAGKQFNQTIKDLNDG
jgi:hypothetical protein